MSLTSQIHSAPARNYLFAVLFTALALLMNLLLAPVIAPYNLLPLFLGAVVLSALLGGLGPGVLSIVLSVLALDYFLMVPRYTLTFLNRADLIRMLSFVAVAALVTWLGDRMRRQLRESEMEKAEQAFLAEAGVLLAEPLDYNEALRNFTRFAVGRFCDWCLIAVIEPGRPHPTLTLAARDPAQQETTQRLEQEYHIDLRGLYGSGKAIATGKTEWVEEITDELLASAVPEPERRALIKRFGIRSFISVPLTARGRTIGAVSFTLTGARRFRARDAALAERLAHLVALAVDSALLFREGHEAEERFRATFEQAGVGIAHTGIDGRVLRVNPKLCDMLGYRADELLQMTFMDVTHPDDLPEDIRLIDQLMAGEMQKLTREKRYLRKDGGVVWGSLTLSVARDAAGVPLYRIAVVEDISERKRVEDTLRESEALFRATFNQAAFGMAHADPQGNFLQVNQKLCDTLGYAVEELLQMTFMEITHPDDLEGDMIQMRRLLSGEIQSYTREKRYLRKDGGVVWANKARSLVRHADGSPAYVIAVIEDITPRKRAEEAVRSAYAFREKILESASNAIFALDWDSRFLLANNALAEISGYSLHELIGQPFGMLFPPEELARIQEHQLRIVVHGERISHCEATMLRKDGARRLVNFSAAPLFEQGKLVSIVATAEDVTERRQMEVALQQEKELLQNVLDTLPVAVWITDETGRITRSNPATRTLYGDSPHVGVAEFDVYKGWWPGTGRRLRAEEWALARAVTRGETVLNEEVEIERFDGARRTILASAMPLRGPADQGLGAIGIAQDITALKRTQEALRESQANLARAQAIARLGSWVWDTASGELSGSDELYRLFGLTPGKPFSLDVLRERLHPDDRARVEAVIGATLEQGQLPQVDYRILLPDGSERTVTVQGEIMEENGSGCPRRIIGTIQDITERKRIENEIRELNVSLERRVAERTAELESFSYSLAHDLRTPLRGMEGFSQILLEDYAGRLDDAGRDCLQRIRLASQRMAALIDAMLNLARVTRTEMQFEAVDLSDMARRIAAQLQASAPLRRVDWTIADGLQVRGDPRLLQVVLENLLGNAWKFTSKHERARIEFGAREEAGERSYFVRDDGAGFDMAYAGKLFQPFQRLHGITEFEGTGIGLATVARIIARHGGRVWAEGSVERGATFCFTLGAAS
ncbi:MAG: PAS domain S-box protein [Pseudomonadota bacterium]